MNNEDSKKLCLSLLHAETAEQIKQILRDHGYWDDKSLWRLYGDKPGNYSTAGGQQSLPDGALVEKLVNSVDASLTAQCLLRKIDPEGNEAPKSIQEAVALFYEEGSKKLGAGAIVEWDSIKRNEESKKITLAATGTKSFTNIVVADLGEGQSPKRLPKTILSIQGENKQKIPFVQGKFNMGGTGVLRHCEDGLQLIISKRNPKITQAWNEFDKDDSVEEWGFTIVRRDEPSGKAGDVLNSEFRYLAPIKTSELGEVLSFKAESIKGMPEYNDPYAREMEYGTIIKVFGYDMSSGGSHILMPDGLLSRLDALLPKIALPISLHECRKTYTSGKNAKKGSFQTPLSGLVVRLEDGKGKNLQADPWDVPFNVYYKDRHIKFRAKFYVFKKGKAKTYTRNEGIIFHINGQAHGHIPKSIFGRKKVGLTRIGKDLVVIVDCSEIPILCREDLFMTSRDRLSNGELRRSTEKQLEDILSQDAVLRRLQEERRQADQEEKLSDEKPLEDVLNTILKSSPSLSALFLKGQRLNMPGSKKQQNNNNASGGEDGKSGGSDKGENDFVGKKHPSYFNFQKKPKADEYKRKCEQGRVVRVNFETDVENGYFTREVNTGQAELSCKNIEDLKFSNYCNLHDGIATWSITLPNDIEIGTKLIFECKIYDDVLLEPFVKILQIEVESKKQRDGGGEKKTNKGQGKGEKPSDDTQGLSMPEMTKVVEGDENWKDMEFNFNTACKIEADKVPDTEDDYSYEFFLNMDNIHLKNDTKNSDQPKLQEAKYIYGNVLLGLSLINDYNKKGKKAKDNENEENGDDLDSGDNIYELQKHVDRVTRAFSPFLIPVIDSLGNLTDAEVTSLSMLGDDE